MISQPDRKSYQKFLMDSGWKKLGFGSMGAVFSHPDHETVLKVFNAKDQAFYSYIGFCKQRPNPNLPKFYAFSSTNGTYYVVEMERLYPLQPENYDMNKLVNTIDEITAFAQTNDYKLEIFPNSGNIMQRLDGTVVFNDPVTMFFPIEVYEQVLEEAVDEY